MAERTSWRPFIFVCPRTGNKVQGLLAGEAADAHAGDYEAVSCMACAGVHFVDSRTGFLMGPNWNQHA